MALLNPNQLKSGIQEVLKASNLKSEMDSTSATKLESLLEMNGLSPEDVLSQVGSMMRAGENEATRLAATKIGLELNKLIGGKQQEGLQAPVVNIIIHGFSGSEVIEVNPILIPR